MNTLETTLVIGVGGFVGANVRYWLSVWIADVIGRSLPYATFVINVSGSLLLGIFLAWIGRRVEVSPMLRPLIAVGFFGAYTTFSSFSNETIALLQENRWVEGALYVVMTNMLCIGGAALGVWLGSRL